MRAHVFCLGSGICSPHLRSVGTIISSPLSHRSAQPIIATSRERSLYGWPGNSRIQVRYSGSDLIVGCIQEVGRLRDEQLRILKMGPVSRVRVEDQVGVRNVLLQGE